MNKIQGMRIIFRAFLGVATAAANADMSTLVAFPACVRHQAAVTLAVAVTAMVGASTFGAFATIFHQTTATLATAPRASAAVIAIFDNVGGSGTFANIHCQTAVALAAAPRTSAVVITIFGSGATSSSRETVMVHFPTTAFLFLMITMLPVFAVLTMTVTSPTFAPTPLFGFVFFC